MISSACAEVKKEYRTCSIRTGQPEAYARSLVAMEQFVAGDLSVEEMDGKIARLQWGDQILELQRLNERLEVAQDHIQHLTRR